MWLQGGQAGIMLHPAVVIQNAELGSPATLSLPGLMDTPMAVDTRAPRHRESRPRWRSRTGCGGAAAPKRTAGTWLNAALSLAR